MSQFPPRAFIRMAAELEKCDTQTKAPTAAQLSTNGKSRFLSLSDVLDRLTISRSLLYELIKDPIQPFPSPAHIGRRSVWLEDEVESYMQAVLQTARQKRAN